MKIWFDCCDLDYFFTDSNVKLGIGWYRHFKGHKWWGATIEIYLIRKIVFINFVSNWKEYDKRMNFRKNEK